jgi:integrase
MPLKLVPPRQGKSPNWTIRGSYLKIAVDQSSGTHRRSVAARIMRDLEERIERGEFPARTPQQEPATFLNAAISYMEAGRRRRYVAKLIAHFNETPLSKIDQAAIDQAAITICPDTTPGTRNACVYTPLSAILHHAGVEIKLRRPKGAKGRVVTDWLSPDDAALIVGEAESFNAEFALLLRFLLYTGVRLGEALALHWNDVRLDDAAAWMRRKKGGPASDAKLREDLRDGLRHHRPQEAHGRVFRFHQGGHLKHLLTRAKLGALGLPCPTRRPTGWQEPPHRFTWVNFHTFRHTWATWMRKFGGLDEIGLKATGNWNDERSARRYAHAVPRDEWSKVELLPAIGSRGKSVA